MDNNTFIILDSGELDKFLNISETPYYENATSNNITDKNAQIKVIMVSM